MKIFSILVVFLTIVGCGLIRKGGLSAYKTKTVKIDSTAYSNLLPNRLKIVQTDTTRYYYVFTSLTVNKQIFTVMAERETFKDCLKQYIIADSVQKAVILYHGRGGKFFFANWIGEIQGVKIKDGDEEFPKIIYSCNALVDH